jgi:hypothetical protein
VGLNFELVFITGVQVQPQLVFLDTIIEIRHLLRWHPVFGRTMAGQRDPSISYDIYVRSIEYISNEQAIRQVKPKEDLSALANIAYLIHISYLLLLDAINSSLIPLSYLLLLDEINSIQTRRRPPPRSRRRSCANVNNPRPQPSILSENLSQFAVSVCQSSRPLAF